MTNTNATAADSSPCQHPTWTPIPMEASRYVCACCGVLARRSGRDIVPFTRKTAQTVRSKMRQSSGRRGLARPSDPIGWSESAFHGEIES